MVCWGCTGWGFVFSSRRGVFWRKIEETAITREVKVCLNYAGRSGGTSFSELAIKGGRDSRNWLFNS